MCRVDAELPYNPPQLIHRRANVSISRRTARSVRILGVVSASAALALGVAGNALACNISEFSAAASCNGDNGDITVTDKDYSSTPVTIELRLGDQVIGSKEQVKGSREGVPVTFTTDWQPNTEYTVHVQAPRVIDDSIQVKTPAEACKAAADVPAAPAETEKPEPAEPAEAAKPAESAPAPSAPESSAAAVAPSSAPSPAGEANLAETGASSSTGVIAGIAGALVVLGGGALVFGMRRRRGTVRG